MNRKVGGSLCPGGPLYPTFPYLYLLLYRYNQYDALIGDGRAGEEAQSFEEGVHVRTCRCTPYLTCVKHLSNGSLVTHKI